MRKCLLILLVAVTLLAAFLPAAQAQYCTSALPIRLQIGGQAQVTPGLPNILRSQPNRGAGSVILGQIPAGAIFTVLGGPVCFDGMNWWQVNYGGVSGWTPEGSSYGVYWTQPLAPVTDCMSVPSRLAVGQAGQVLPGLPNVLRSEPDRSTTSVVLANMSAGSVFTLLSGPICSGGMNWWQVNFNGVVGWTPEGQGDIYWLQPYGIVTPPNPCYATQTPHMLVGYTGIVKPGVPNRLRAQPSINAAALATMPSGEAFTVLSGPNCADGLLWWQISYRGTTGWTAEGQNGGFWIDPVVCPGFRPSRLATGRYARVTPGLPNRLRVSPSTLSLSMALIPAGAAFTVTGGPVCGESAAWWQISYQGISGWTMEGQGNSYWLELAN